MDGMIVLGLKGVLADRTLAAVLGGGGLVALAGLVDDYRDLPVSRRLVLQFVAATWTLYWSGGVPGEILPGVSPILVNVLGVVAIAWLVNLFNFMDGIDGIASIETISVCLGGIILYVLGTAGETAWIPPALLLASVSGFVIWNVPPARIFLGDSGSGFLGFMMAVLCLQAARFDPLLFWAWLILLGVFIVDSGVTLVRRLLRRHRLYEAHRSHGYQFAARRHGGHLPVSMAVGAINLAWLLPIALLASTGSVPFLLALVIAYSPLVWLAFRYKSGAPESQDI
jgi:Fuc2NAc and GlcNAc transferase